MELAIPLESGQNLQVPCEPGSATFIVGANGTGKTALMVKFKQDMGEQARRIIAARPLVLQADAPEIAASQAVSQRNSVSSWDSEFRHRAKVAGVYERAQLYLHTLAEMESAFQRETRTAFEAVDLHEETEGQLSRDSIERLRQLQANRSPLAKINQSLDVAGFAIQLKIHTDGQVKAVKENGAEYGVSETSDGERAAIVLLIETLGADQGQLVLIDEPERHIHRSLLHPLLLELLDIRRDCTFVVSTHDIEFVSQFASPVILLREMTAINERWVADIVDNPSAIDDSIRENILGGRRKVLFVEGSRDGLDDRLYNLLFRGVSVFAKGGSRSVIEATRGSRELNGLAWLSTWGIIDRDGRADGEVAALRGRGLWPLPIYSVESIYYHPEVLQHLIDTSAVVSADVSVTELGNQACNDVRPQLERLAARAIEKSVRDAVIKSIPKWDEFKDTEQLAITERPKERLAEELQLLTNAVDESDWEALVARCPIRETNAPTKIAKLLGFAGRKEYEETVRHTVATDAGLRTKLQSLLGEPVSGLEYRQ